MSKAVCGHPLRRAALAGAALLRLAALAADPSSAGAGEAAPLTLKAWGVATSAAGSSPEAVAGIKIQREFTRLHPQIRLLPATGLQIPGRTGDTIPLMQIAADISPAVIYVNFRQSSTYIAQKFLYPLDQYLERAAGVEITDGHLLPTPAYAAALRRGARYAEQLEERIAPQSWAVIRRECPYGAGCPYVKAWGGTPAGRHHHVWALPQNQVVIALYFRKDLFAEAGLPPRAPADMDEFLRWARELHNPTEDVYGVQIALEELSCSTLSFFYSCGARAIEEDEQGRWRCVFNSPEAVDAYYYVARLFLEPFTNRHGRFEGVVNLGDQSAGGAIQYAMYFGYVGQNTFDFWLNPDTTGFGPVPTGPGGRRGSEFNAAMAGIYAGYEHDRPLRDAAWEWMLFWGGPEADLIRARVFAEAGLAQFVKPALLDKAGYPEFKEQIPAGWVEAADDALLHGVPEPYGKNCQLVYRYMSQAIDQIRTDGEVRRCIVSGDEAGARRRIQSILDVRVAFANRKMLNVMPASVRRFQSRVAAAAALAALAVFALVLWQTVRVFSRGMIRSAADRARGEWQFGRHKPAYLILLPAVLSIAVWSYWPLLRGTLMAFQEYNVRGFSAWIGFENFATVMFSAEFWHAMLVSLQYTVLFMTFGFVAPIVLAILLSEVPRGKILFRVIFYLPAMLAGVVVIFLWKGFYGENGMINQVLNLGVQTVNFLFGADLPEVKTVWLSSPRFALFFCVLPTIWAGMGPGCLIYLAALKGIPDDLYEAADIDGAGTAQKAWHIAIPSIKALIAINFIGAAIGCMQSGSGFILAMTGGGPYTPYGATEVIGLHIFWEAFGYLRFGVATAMAWVLGSMLVGFTIQRLQKLSKMEFKAAGGVDGQ